MMTTAKASTKTLADIIDSATVLPATATAPVIQGLALDSRQLKPGEVFLAVKGAGVDGRDFIDDAIAAGAAAVLADRDEALPASTLRGDTPVVAVEDLGWKLSAIAARFFDAPSARMPLVGVTGTNGKTSCTHLLMQLMAQCGRRCGVIGTLGVGVNGALVDSINTTPDAVTLQKTIAGWLADGVDIVAMEVSSHGLEQGRVAALCFDVAIFTNLTRDHLDYHGSMQAYAAAKLRLFQMDGLKTAVINADDDYAPTLLAHVPASVACYTYSLDRERARLEIVDVRVEDVSYHHGGVSASLKSPWGDFQLQSHLLGSFNLSNVLAVFTAAAAQGMAAQEIVAAIPGLRTVPGRMEPVATVLDLVAVVDYAHTPDALEKALLAMRHHTRGKLWCVFGCGGDRDTGKRPQMGAMAQRYADHVVVTSDNPRHEDPALIINDILAGVDRPTLVEEDRARAIAFAIARADIGDGVLVAGKGHEPYQQVGDQRLPFSDIQQVQQALAEREQTQGRLQ